MKNWKFFFLIGIFAFLLGGLETSIAADAADNSPPTEAVDNAMAFEPVSIQIAATAEMVFDKPYVVTAVTIINPEPPAVLEQPPRQLAMGATLFNAKAAHYTKPRYLFAYSKRNWCS